VAKGSSALALLRCSVPAISRGTALARRGAFV